MRKYIFLVLALLLVASVNAADIFNVGAVYNGNTQTVPSTGNIVAYWENYTSVTYKFRFTFVDSSDNYHSKPIYIGDCNAVDGYSAAIQSATGDANVILHFSADDRSTWFAAVTAGDQDAVSSTSKEDTVGIEQGSNDLKFHGAQWLVVELASGSSTNQDDNILTYTITMTKDLVAVKPNGDYVSVARVANKSNTNP